MQDRKSYIYLLCISKIGGRIRPGKRLKKVRPAVVTEVKVFLQKKKKNEKGFLYLKTSKKEPSWGGLYWCALKKNLSATLQLIGARQKDPIYSRIRETSHRYKPSKGYRKYYLKKFLLLLLSATQEVNANRPEMAWISRGMHRYTTHLAIIILCPFFCYFWWWLLLDGRFHRTQKRNVGPTHPLERKEKPNWQLWMTCGKASFASAY